MFSWLQRVRASQSNRTQSASAAPASNALTPHHPAANTRSTTSAASEFSPSTIVVALRNKLPEQLQGSLSSREFAERAQQFLQVKTQCGLAVLEQSSTVDASQTDASSLPDEKWTYQRKSEKIIQAFTSGQDQRYQHYKAVRQRLNQFGMENQKQAVKDQFHYNTYKALLIASEALDRLKPTPNAGALYRELTVATLNALRSQLPEALRGQSTAGEFPQKAMALLRDKKQWTLSCIDQHANNTLSREGLIALMRDRAMYEHKSDQLIQHFDAVCDSALARYKTKRDQFVSCGYAEQTNIIKAEFFTEVFQLFLEINAKLEELIPPPSYLNIEAPPSYEETTRTH